MNGEYVVLILLNEVSKTGGRNTEPNIKYEEQTENR
jgi:hypothetical protein